MKVLLINPPLHNMISANVPSFVEEERGTYPPLGLLYIAAYLREYGPRDVEIQVLDTILEAMDYQAIEDKIRKEDPAVVAAGALTFTLIDALKTLKITKQVNPEIITIIGGHHCDIYPKETIRFKFIDYLIQGEGEIPFTRLITNLNKKENLRKIQGLSFRTTRGIISNPPQIIDNLDTIPFPARELTPYKKYRFLLAKNALFTTLMTSRGCPYRCSFCDEGHKRFRAISAPRIVDEIIACQKKFNMNTFFIFDSTFTVDRKRVIDFCQELRKRKVDLIFDVRTRINLVDPAMLKELRQAGCIRIQYGIESGNDQILKNINKLITVKQTRKVVQETRKQDFEILCDFMIGLPGEKEKEIMDTINLALDLPIDYAHFAITTPYPHTKLYQDGIDQGLFPDYWRQFSSYPKAGFEPLFWEENFKKDELIAYLCQAYSRFYKRPGYVWREFQKIRTAGELWRKMRGGLKVLTRT